MTFRAARSFPAYLAFPACARSLWLDDCQASIGAGEKSGISEISQNSSFSVSETSNDLQRHGTTQVLCLLNTSRGSTTRDQPREVIHG